MSRLLPLLRSRTARSLRPGPAAAAAAAPRPPSWCCCGRGPLALAAPGGPRQLGTHPKKEPMEALNTAQGARDFIYSLHSTERSCLLKELHRFESIAIAQGEGGGPGALPSPPPAQTPAAAPRARVCVWGALAASWGSPRRYRLPGPRSVGSPPARESRPRVAADTVGVLAGVALRLPSRPWSPCARAAAVGTCTLAGGRPRGLGESTAGAAGGEKLCRTVVARRRAGVGKEGVAS